MLQKLAGLEQSNNLAMPLDYIEFFYNPLRKYVRNGMLSLIVVKQQQKLKQQGV